MSYVGLFFFVDVMFLKLFFFLSYLSRLRAGLFSNLCFVFKWLLKCVLRFSILPSAFENIQMN